MLKIESIHEDRPGLQWRAWPPVPAFVALPADLQRFLDADAPSRSLILQGLRGDSEAYGKFLHDGLATIYAYVYGYPDSPCYLQSAPALEALLLGAKVVLEEEMINYWLPTEPVPPAGTQGEAIAYLRGFSLSNAGVDHALFDYLRDDATRAGMGQFLRLEVCRNEVVDDEVALLVRGLQGNMKKVIASNLFDECGNGALNRFHTYWLRRLVERQDDWDGLVEYRRTAKPWFASITSNIFNALLTRPGYKYRAYGCFIVTEAWVEAHFNAILAGLRRLELDQDDVAVYFRAHKNIDPQHTDELLTALLHQTPALSAAELSEVMLGAHLAVAAGISQYQRILQHLRQAASEGAA